MKDDVCQHNGQVIKLLLSGEGRGGGGELSRWRLAHGEHHSHHHHDDHHRYHDDDLQVRVGIASQNSALCLSVDAAPGLTHHVYHSDIDDDDHSDIDDGEKGLG